MAGPEDRRSSAAKPTAPTATPAQVKTFTTGVDKAQADFNKSLAAAKSTLAQANKQGNKVVAASARGLIDQLNTVVKPSLAILQKAENPNAAYTGEIAGINKALGSGPSGSGPTGAVLGSGGTGAYTTDQIRSYMNANNGNFPPDLNTIASGITAADLTNLVNQYESGAVTPTGGTTPESTSGTTGSSISKESRDAFAILDSAFKQYGLETLAGKIKDFMLQGLTSNEAIIELRKTSEYQTRFAGNAARLKSGLNSLSEGEYLALEDSYSETLRAYGQQAFFGVDRNARQAKIAEIIGADISAVEFKDRIATVVNRVESADPVIKATLRDFYKISDTDLVGYFLNPKENLPKLQEKVTAAEIGSAALNQGLDTSVASAEALAKAGVDLATARRGYSAIADVLPTATKLSQIYDESGMKYTQATAEAETFEGLASAQRKRMALAELELAQFSGRSGVGKTSLARKPAGLI